MGVALGLALLVGCHPGGAPTRSAVPAGAPENSDRGQLDPAQAAAEQRAKTTSERRLDSQLELERRFELALFAFDEGAYEDAAGLFAQALLQVEETPRGDALRHLLVQHVAWSLLGVYDTQGQVDALDRGEALLARYLVKHEELRPMDDGGREVIYELLAEYASRRAGEPPAEVNAQLRSLTSSTARTIRGQGVSARRRANEDSMVRVVVVERERRVHFAERDDPGVAAFHRDLRYTGPSLFERGGEPFNPTRVLVRGWISSSEGRGASRQSFAALRQARPALEQCYEQALIRGAPSVVRTQVELRWGGGARGVARLDGPTRFDGSAQACLSAALEAAGSGGVEQPEGRARLHLTFFVQAARWPDSRTPDHDDGGPWVPDKGGQINRGAAVEDVSVGLNPPAPRSPGGVAGSR